MRFYFEEARVALTTNPEMIFVSVLHVVIHLNVKMSVRWVSKRLVNGRVIIRTFMPRIETMISAAKHPTEFIAKHDSARYECRNWNSKWRRHNARMETTDQIGFVSFRFVIIVILSSLTLRFLCYFIQLRTHILPSHASQPHLLCPVLVPLFATSQNGILALFLRWQ